MHVGSGSGAETSFKSDPEPKKAFRIRNTAWESIGRRLLCIFVCRRPAQEHQPAPHPLLLLPLLCSLLSQEQGTVLTTCHCACWFWGGWRDHSFLNQWCGPRWVLSESGSSFFSRCGSGSREPNQCGSIRIRILVKLPSTKKFNFYMKNIQKHTYEGTKAFLKGKKACPFG